ncbi:hypothetical protein [Nitrospira sp. Kam-Ns4a]
MHPRELTHDERKAAEAAFRGLPLDPSWTGRAKAVYEGLLKAMGAQAPVPADGLSEALGSQAATVSGATGSAAPFGERHADVVATGGPADAMATPQLASRADAIAAGFLIDVSEQAAAMGLRLPVGISRPLWEAGITASQSLPDDEHSLRVRDVLMALRLHLIRLPGLPVVSQFPALLTFPPEPIPQICLISAVVHADEANRPALILALPSELSTTIGPKLN